MAIVFPKSRFWPLPPDYDKLDAEGQKLARVNAVSLRGTPELSIASWHFFREHYLTPTPKGFFYPHGIVKSPQAHYQIVGNWATHDLTVTEAPRSFAKSTLLRENVLKDLLTIQYSQNLLFLAKMEFIKPWVDIVMLQLTDNQWIVDDFGSLKGKRGKGSWSHSFLKLSNGAVLQTLPIGGAVLGPRPHKVTLDDVEKDDSQQKQRDNMEEMIERARTFFFNDIYPMAEAGVPIRIVGTRVHDRSFIHYLATTDDPAITKYFHRTILKAEYADKKNGETKLIWAEKMSRKWLDRQRAIMGDAAYSVQYLNEAGTDHKRCLHIHPELCTYWLKNADPDAYKNPLLSGASVITHQLGEWKINEEGDERIPVPRRVERQWADVVTGMRRFITVDYADTVSPAADFSVVHVLGLENNEVHRDTLWSLDIWVGKVTREILVRRIFEMARRWDVWLVGIEHYPVIAESSERLLGDVKGLFKGQDRMPAVIPVKFPTTLSKPEKIKGLTWRFNQFRMKLPLDREVDHAGYRALFEQVRRFTPDMALLRYDDAIDTLAMHQGIGKPRPAAFADVPTPKTPVDHLREGQLIDEDTGLSWLTGVNIADIPPDVLRQLRNQAYDQREEDPDVQWIEEGIY